MAPTISFTWFGPPDERNRDVLGPRSIAKATSASGEPITLFCMERYRERLQANVPAARVVARAWESDFEELEEKPATMRRRDPDNLDKNVWYIMSKMLADDARPKAFAKDFWSLWCMYKHGGYHLDTGVTAYDEHAPAVFNEPDKFAAPAIVPDAPTTAAPAKKGKKEGRKRFRLFSTNRTAMEIEIETGRGDPGLKFKHGTVNFDGDRVCAAIGEKLAKRANLTVTPGPPPLQPGFPIVDVWLLRSPQGNAAARRALELYIRVWFHLENQGLSGSHELYRLLIITAVATGFSHSKTNGECVEGVADIMPHVIPIKVTPFTGIDDFNLKKTGFRTHRVVDSGTG